MKLTPANISIEFENVIKHIRTVANNLRIYETAKNLTKSLNTKLPRTKNPFEIKIDLDVSQNFIDLTQRIIFLVPITLILSIVLIYLIIKLSKKN